MSNNPDLKRRLMAITDAEVGDDNDAAKQAFIESVMNRAARNQSLDAALHSIHNPVTGTGYFDPRTGAHANDPVLPLWSLCEDPGPLLWILPAADEAKTFSTTRLKTAVYEKSRYVVGQAWLPVFTGNDCDWGKAAQFSHAKRQSAAKQIKTAMIPTASRLAWFI
jgi:hypothetical protein